MAASFLFFSSSLFSPPLYFGLKFLVHSSHQLYCAQLLEAFFIYFADWAKDLQNLVAEVWRVWGITQESNLLSFVSFHDAWQYRTLIAFNCIRICSPSIYQLLVFGVQFLWIFRKMNLLSDCPQMFEYVDFYLLFWTYRQFAPFIQC